MREREREAYRERERERERLLAHSDLVNHKNNLLSKSYE